MNNSNTSTFQPMGFGEILDTTFSLYRQHFLLFLGIISLDFFGSSVAYLLARFLPDFFLKYFVINLVRGLLALVSMGGIIIATTAIYFGRHITSQEALRQTGHRFWHMLACQFPLSFVFEISGIGFAFLITSIMDIESTQVLFTSIFLVSTLFSIHLPIRLWNIIFRLVSFVFMRSGLMWVRFIPLALAPFSVYFVVRWTFTTATVLLERPSIRSAFERSSELTRGRWWQVWGLLISFSILSFAIKRIIEITIGLVLVLTKLPGVTDPMDIILRSVRYLPIGIDTLLYEIMMWTELVAGTLVFPIWIIGITLLYFDLRIQKDGFNVGMSVNNTAN